MMKVHIVCPLLALLSGALAAPEGDSTKWEHFKAKFGKRHPAHEESERMQRFLERDADIHAHNARYAAGLESFSRQHSRYSDLNDDEINNSAFGFTAAINISDLPLAEAPMMPSALRQFDWRKHYAVTSVKDQARCGACYAFTATALIESYIKWRTGFSFDLAEQDIVDCSYRRYMHRSQNNGCQGGDPKAALRYFNQKDLIPERRYPYTSGESGRHGKCNKTKKRYDVMKGRLRIKHERPMKEDYLEHLLISKGPLILSMAADAGQNSTFLDLANGVFDVPGTDKAKPNHAVLLIGFGVEHKKRYWLVKNSWGTSWGVKGFGKLARGKNMCNIMASGVWYLQ